MALINQYLLLKVKGKLCYEWNSYIVIMRRLQKCSHIYYEVDKA